MDRVYNENRLKIARRVLIFWTLFIGIGAVAGAFGMLSDPSGKAMGMNVVVPYLQTLPFGKKLFQNLIFAGIMLLIVNGITNLTASIFLFKKKKIGYVLGTIFGFTLMLWIIIQFCCLPANFMSIIYFFFGLFQLIAGISTLIFNKQLKFKFDKKAVTISENSDTAVFYFSRCGYTEKIACNYASQEGAMIEQITTPEKTEHNSGFWWCGRYAMHRWDMPIDEIKTNLDNVKKVIIVTPIWVFAMSSPIRCFVKKYSKQLENKEITFVFNHFMPWLPHGAVKEVNKYFNNAKIISYTTHYGVSHLNKKSY